MKGFCAELVIVDGQEIPCGRPKSKRSNKWCYWHWQLQQSASVRDESARARGKLTQDPAAVWPTDMVCSVCSWAVPTWFMGRGKRCIGCEGIARHESHVVNTYDLTRGDYAALTALQLGRCAICRRKQNFQRLAVDHDHPTDRKRGLLCLHCNEQVLGSLGGDTEKALPLARALVYYLEHHPTSGRWYPPELQPEFGFPQPGAGRIPLETSILGDPDPDAMKLAPFYDPLGVPRFDSLTTSKITQVRDTRLVPTGHQKTPQAKPAGSSLFALLRLVLGLTFQDRSDALLGSPLRFEVSCPCVRTVVVNLHGRTSLRIVLSRSCAAVPDAWRSARTTTLACARALAGPCTASAVAAVCVALAVLAPM